MTCRPDPELPGLLCGPPGFKLSDLTEGDRQALAEFEQLLRDLHAAEQSNPATSEQEGDGA